MQAVRGLVQQFIDGQFNRSNLAWRLFQWLLNEGTIRLGSRQRLPSVHGMYAHRLPVNGLVAKIRQAERKTIQALKSARVEQEPSVTDRLLAAMEQAIDGTEIGGITWTAKTLTDRGRRSQESEFGADFLAVFRASLPDLDIAKGFLAQAKLVEPGERFPTSEAARLKAQCAKMLAHSPASYVFLYSKQAGIFVVPAIEVLATGDCNPHELAPMPMGRFYKQHFECFVGDRGLQTADPKGLYALRDRVEARELFLLSAGGWKARPAVDQGGVQTGN